MSDDETKSVEGAIATYRDELTAEADLARGDLDEIEDHLRSLTGELREQGLPRAEAIAEACRRLGEPRQLAREHARVRTPFGAKLSRLRSWSAAVLLLPYAFNAIMSSRHFGMLSPAGLECGLVVLVFAALVFRLTWARPIVIGTLASSLVWNIASFITVPNPIPLWFVMSFLTSHAALVFLVPWRRGELTPAAWALALLAPAYGAAAMTLWFFMSAPGRVVLMNPLGFLSTAFVLVAGLGILMRARWAAIASGLCSLALLGAAYSFLPLVMRSPSGEAWHTLMTTHLVIGAITSAIASVVCWRTARSKLGTLRHVLS